MNDIEKKILESVQPPQFDEESDCPVKDDLGNQRKHDWITTAKDIVSPDAATIAVKCSRCGKEETILY